MPPRATTPVPNTNPLRNPVPFLRRKRIRDVCGSFVKKKDGDAFGFLKPPKTPRTNVKASFGVREYTPKDLERHSGNNDPTFDNVALRDSKSSPASQSQVATHYYDESENPASNGGQDAHASSDISLNELLAPLPSATAQGSFGQPRSRLQELLGVPAGATGNNLNRDSSGLPSLSSPATMGGQDPINLSPDTSRQSMQPIIGSRMDSPGGRSGFAVPSASSRSPNSAASSFFPPGGMNRSSSRVTGFSSLPTPSYQPPKPPPAWTSPLPNKPPDRRF